jgi:hypothetical protein
MPHSEDQHGRGIGRHVIFIGKMSGMMRPKPGPRLIIFEKISGRFFQKI